MSVISRSSRITSSSTIASSALLLGILDARRVSIALWIEVSGFLISCATSAAKCSIASMRAHSAPVISRKAPESSPISSPRW